MILRGTDFGPVWGASGVQGFFGEGYWYHRWIPGLDFTGCTFVSKTTTLEPRLDPEKKLGNMPMREDGITPRERKPKCIVVKPWKGVVLNSVGLSGPGARALFEAGRFQTIDEPFLLSFMAMGNNIHERMSLLRGYLRHLEQFMPGIRAHIALQMNFSCPNVKEHYDDLATEVCVALGTAAKLGIPLIPKLNALVPIEVALRIAEHKDCDALCVSNAIPWGQLPDRIDWKGLFGSDVSPLAHLGGGGLSGAPLLPIVADWIRDARKAGLKKPINAGGGILRIRDIDTLADAGANSVFLGSAAMLRGWRVHGLVRHAHQVFARRQLPAVASSPSVA